MHYYQAFISAALIDALAALTFVPKPHISSLIKSSVDAEGSHR